MKRGETDDDVLGKLTLDFKELSVIDNRVDDLIHVVWTVGRVGDDFIERIFETVDGVVTFNQRRFFEIVLWDVAEKLADDAECFFSVFCREVGDTALLGVYGCAAECFLADIFAGHGLDHLRTSKEHVADALGHDGEVGECG